MNEQTQKQKKRKKETIKDINKETIKDIDIFKLRLKKENNRTMEEQRNERVKGMTKRK